MATQFITANRETWIAWASQQGDLHRCLFTDIIGDRQGEITLKKVTTTHTESWKLPTERELRRLAKEE